MLAHSTAHCGANPHANGRYCSAQRVSNLHCRPPNTNVGLSSTLKKDIASARLQQRGFLRQLQVAASVATQQKLGRNSKRLSEIKKVLTKDFKSGQYLVTGNLTEDIYTRFCRISDPTGVIWGIKLYRFIIANLFDPQDSSIQLKNISITGPANIEAVWAKEGFLQLPWRPYLTRQEGKTIYTINQAGMICDHKQIWTNMTALQGIKLALTPSKQLQ